MSGGGITKPHRCRPAAEYSSKILFSGLRVITADGAHGAHGLDSLYVIRWKRLGHLKRRGTASWSFHSFSLFQ